jgi:structural maintenance of chromosome 2
MSFDKKIREESEIAKKLEAELIEKKREITKNETELNNLKLEKEKMEKKRDEIGVELKKVETRITKYEKEIRDNEDKLAKLENENKWIITEKDFFGIKDTDYDFSQIDAKSEIDKLNKLKEENATLRRKVNMKVDIMADQYEKEYNDLIKKREIIVKDKTNIEKAIKELDEKRKDALEDIYSQVNKNLDSIYSTLLPGTKAKLDPVGVSLMDGLELKVAFNNTWKKSLSELSGGQRSLLALSLILSLLLYKPAPFYILDEIDAALDLSHTANLGLMIREHFPQSQFIVVSLKDGMFNNANVLFKVSFVDGSSKVDRISKEKK